MPTTSGNLLFDPVLVVKVFCYFCQDLARMLSFIVYNAFIIVYRNVIEEWIVFIVQEKQPSSFSLSGTHLLSVLCIFQFDVNVKQLLNVYEIFRITIKLYIYFQ